MGLAILANEQEIVTLLQESFDLRLANALK